MMNTEGNLSWTTVLSEESVDRLLSFKNVLLAEILLGCFLLLTIL